MLESQAREQDADSVFWGLVVSAFTREEISEEHWQDARSKGAFPKLSQQQRDPVALKPKDQCKHQDQKYRQFSNRGFLSVLIDDLQLAMPDQHARFEGFRPSGHDVDENKFTIHELRGINELGRWLIQNDHEDWLKKLVQREFWSIGDIKLISDFGKAHNAQSGVQKSVRIGSEFKDDGDLGVYGGPGGGWKDPWSRIKDPLEAMRHNWTKIQPVRDAQLNARSPKDFEDLQKKAGSAEAEAKRFNAEVMAIDSPAFWFALDHNDLSEYVRMSPNFDGKDWVEIPDDLTGSHLQHVKNRIQAILEKPTLFLSGPVKNRLRGHSDLAEAAEANTRASEHPAIKASGRTREELALLQVLYFRSKQRVDAISQGWDIKWEEAFDHLTNGPELVDLILEPSGRRQSLAMTGRSIDLGTRWFLDRRIDLPGRVMDVRVATIVFFAFVAGFLGIFSILLFGELYLGHILAGTIILTAFFDMSVGQALRRQSIRPLLAILALLLGLVLFVKVGGDFQRQFLEAQNRPQDERFMDWADRNR